MDSLSRDTGFEESALRFTSRLVVGARGLRPVLEGGSGNKPSPVLEGGSANKPRPTSEGVGVSKIMGAVLGLVLRVTILRRMGASEVLPSSNKSVSICLLKLGWNSEASGVPVTSGSSLGDAGTLSLIRSF